MIIFDTVLPRK